MKLFRFFIFLNLFVATGCRVELQDLCSARNPNSSTILKTHGYFYHEWESQDKLDILFLNSNGIMSASFFVETPDTSILYQKLFDDGFYDGDDGHALEWGIFHIVNNSIFMEKWYPSNRLVPGINEGEILNDSTFVFTFFYDCDHSDFHLQNEIWHFKPFYNKPDSICEFID